MTRSAWARPLALLGALEALTGRSPFSRDPGPPPGTTHVLEHLPAALLQDPDPADAGGWWELQPLTAWHAGRPLNDPPWFPGPGTVPADTLTVFAENELGYPVTLHATTTDIKIGGRRHIGGGRWHTEPACYITRREA
jgi:hypothetical protein